MKSLSNLFFLLGVVCLVIFVYFIYQRTNPNRLAFASEPNYKNLSSINSSQTPARLIIEDLEISLPIISTKINGKKWEATVDGVSYLTTSILPGEYGNAIFYGHNWPSLLGRLNKAKLGQIVKTKSTSGLEKEFEIKYIQVVNPDEVDVLKSSDDRRITLYTCTGFLDSKRLVIVAILKDS